LRERERERDLKWELPMLHFQITDEKTILTVGSIAVIGLRLNFERSLSEK
jgi:hypothetical protein